MLSGIYLFLLGRIRHTDQQLPVFLRMDTLAQVHQTSIRTTVHALHQPDSAALAVLTKDYADLWAHLNHLYTTNDVERGKEYYTEEWFRQINRHSRGMVATGIRRDDLRHDLHIVNWAWDGLICAAIDSNIVFRYTLPGQRVFTDTSHLAVVLVFQGDHWRLDALRVLPADSMLKIYENKFN